MSQKAYTIGELSALCDVPIKTLHYYDQIGLLPPSERDQGSGYRYYSDCQIYSLFKIKKLQSLGFSLKDIHTLVASDDTRKLVEAIALRLEVMRQNIRNLQNQYTEGVSFLERLRRGNNIISSLNPDINELLWREEAETVRLEDIPMVHTISVRYPLPNYQNADINITRWLEILNLTKKYRLIPMNSIRVTYHHSPLSQFFLQECDYEVHMEVDKNEGFPEAKDFGGFQAVTTFHIGSYDTIINAHLRALRWVYEHQQSVSGCVTEEFVISPLDVTDTGKYLTKIIFPIADIKENV